MDNNISPSLFVRIEPSGELLSLYPFMVLINKKVFFFDSFLPSKNRSEFLDYKEGERKSYKKYDEIGKHIIELHELYGKALSSLKLSSGTVMLDSAEEDSMLYEIEEDMKNKSINDDSVQIESFEKWLNDKIKYDKNGLYIVRGKSGTGKTVCMKQIERGTLSKRVKGGRIKIQDVTPKVLYLNTSYNREFSWIKQDIEKLFGYSEIKGMPTFPSGLNNILPRSTFANYMSEVHKILIRHRMCVKKLLLVIDGIDEMGVGTASEFLSFIPRSNELHEDTYILLTCRTDKEISSDLIKIIRELSISKENTFNIDDKSIYQINMRKYVDQEMGCTIDENIKKKIIEHSRNKFSYLHFIIRMYKTDFFYSDNRDNNEDENYDISIAVRKYFDLVELAYGAKYSRKFFDVLILILISENALNLKTISILIGEGRISFELIGILQDMAEFVSTDRISGEYYFINHSTIHDQLMEHADKRGIKNEALRRLRKEWTKKFKDISEDHKKMLTESDVAFLTSVISIDYLPDVANEYNQEYINHTMSKEKSVTFLEMEELFEGVNGSNLFWLYFRLKKYEQENQIKLSKDFYDGMNNTLIPLQAILIMEKNNERIKRTRSSVDLLKLVSSKQFYKIGENDGEYTYQGIGYRLFESQINWRKWLSSMYLKQKINLIEEERSELNKCYNQLCAFIDSNIIPGEFVGFYLEAVKALNVALFGAYMEIGNNELEIKYRNSTLSILTLIEKKVHGTEGAINPGIGFLSRMHSLYTILGDKDSLMKIEKYMTLYDDLEIGGDDQWLHNIIKLKNKYDVAAYRYIKNFDEVDYREYLALSEKLKSELTIHLMNEQHNKNRELISYAGGYMSTEEKISNEEHDKTNEFKSVQAMGRLYKVLNVLPEDSEIFSNDNKFTVIVVYTFSLIKLMYIEEAKKIYDEHLTDFKGVEKIIRSFKLEKLQIDAIIEKMNWSIYLLSLVYPEIKYNEKFISRYQSSRELKQYVAIVDMYKNGPKINLEKAEKLVETRSALNKHLETNQASHKKIYPNDPCPCGSGKKYKKCHGRTR